MAAARFAVATTWASTQVVVRSVGAAMSRWGDPRRRLLRQRRAALHTTVALGSVSGAFTTGTVGLAVLDAPSLLIAAGCGLTALVATPTVGAAVRLRRLHKRPLPPERINRAGLPPRRSATHAPLRRLGVAEISLRELVSVLDANVVVPSGEVHEVGTAAAAAAVVLRRQATDLLALERARDTSALAAAELQPVLNQLAAQLEDGVHEYERVVAAAARAVAISSTRGAHAQTLQDTVERIDGLTQALAELAGMHRGASR